MKHVEERKYIEFPCICVEQPLGTFYLGSLKCQDAWYVSFADVRRLVDRDLDNYLGIQRPLRSQRVAAMKEYVHNVDASFPTSIILATTSDYAEYDEKKGVMRILRRGDACRILDGQHRIAALEGFEDTFDINVALFVDMDIEDQAHLFATINLTQTKIPRSLAYDLFELARSRSPQKTAHDIVRLLNRRPESPLFERIKILGVADGGYMQLLTQSTLVESVLPLISEEPLKDRDILKRGRKLHSYVGKDLRAHPFRQAFLAGKDEIVYHAVEDVLLAASKTWAGAWASIDRGMILNRTNGVTALLRLLRYVYIEGHIEPGSSISVDSWTSMFRQVPLKDQDFNSDRFPPGTSGHTELFRCFAEVANKVWGKP